MKILKSSSIVCLPVTVAALLVAAAPLAHASTIWNGPNIGFYHTQENNLQDQMTANVIITRGGSGGLYNSVTEAGATSGISPKGTAWAVGTLLQFTNGVISSNSFGACPLEAGHNPPSQVGTTFVVHLITNDIYLQLTLTNWGGGGGVGDKTFGYTRSTPAATAPTVTITNPPSGAVFAAPANVTIAASAAVSGGTVTNVQFFANATSLGSVTSAPFKLTSSGLTANSYALTAVATAGGISATSATVNVSVVNPLAVTLSGVNVSSSQFSFNYTANSGLSYVVQSSSNLVNWVSLATNIASGNPVPFSDPFNPTGAKYYRVGRLPNP